jgi:type VI protein secretion system component VasK
VLRERDVDQNLAWLTIVGTLGGVAITALFGLLTAYFTHRWQRTRSKDDSRLALDREIRMIRREAYARYVVSAQNVYQAAIAHYVANRDRPRNRADTEFDPPADLRAVIV